jgi:hypothetical protein
MGVVERDPFAEYKKCLRDEGESEETIERTVAKMIRDGEMIDRGLCPECGGGLSRRIDPRQVGLPEQPGTWVNYRCAGCGYMADRKEALVIS